MKRVLAFLMTLSLTAFGLVYARADIELKSGDYTCVLRDDGALVITYYNGEDEALIIPEEIAGKKVTGLGDFAFANSCNLSFVFIPDSVAEVGMNPFAMCNKLKEISVSSNHTALEVIDGVLFSKADKRLITFPKASKKAEYMIPQGTQIIGDYAFCDCGFFSSITIPDSVTGIGHWAFAMCFGLDYITIPDSVTSIGESVNEYSGFIWVVGHGSYAEQYCKENNIKYTYPDTLD